MSLFAELQRRNVFRVAALYVVGGWLILQIGDLLFDLMGLPAFALRIVLGILLLGFPAALVLAWIYELTPEGLKRDSEGTRSEATASNTGRKLNIAVIVAVVLALGALGLDRLLPERSDVEETEKGSGTISAAENVLDPFSTSPASKSRESGASIAVLPFADLSPEGNQRYFVDGLSEELLNVLAGVENLTVASRTSSFAYRDQVKNIPVIARELKVGHVLEGSVRKAGNRIRITAQLIDAAADRHLWSENYDRELTDIFAIQDEIATAIVAALQDALGIAEPAAAVTVEADTANLGAYELYLEGRASFIARDTSVLVGITALERAVEIDPEFARAWEALASSLAVATSWMGDAVENAEVRSRQAAERAIALAPELSQPYAVLGNLAFREKLQPKARAIELLDAALERDPRNATALLWRGLYVGVMGFIDAGAQEVQRCLDLEPAYENCRRHAAYLAASAGDLDAALGHFEVGVEHRFSPNDSILVPLLMQRGHRLAAKLVVSGVFTDAIEERYRPSIATVAAWFAHLDDPGGALPPDALARIRREATAANPILSRSTFAIAWAPLLLDLGLWDLLPADTETLLNIWQPERAAFRASDEFKTLIRTMGIDDYWRDVGFPPQCRPVGEDDFACD